MKVATWNVNGIRARQTELQDFIEREAPDVLCLQEIKAGIDQLPVWVCELEGYWCYWHGGKGYSGVGLHVRKAWHPERPLFDHPEFDYEHRIVTAQLPQATVASIYVPNGGKDFPAKVRFLEAMDAYASQFQSSGRALVLCGDLNVAHTEIDLARPKDNVKNHGFTPEERAGFDAFVRAGFVDTFREFEKCGGHYTWWSQMSGARGRNIGWRIDYFLCSAALRPRLKSARIYPEITGSDHCPIGIELKIGSRAKS